MTAGFRQSSHVRVIRPMPDDTKVRMLAAFVNADRSLSRRDAETIAFGVTTTTAAKAAHAVRELRSAGYIERHPLHDRRYVATDLGRQMLAFVKACETPAHPSGGAS